VASRGDVSCTGDVVYSRVDGAQSFIAAALAETADGAAHTGDRCLHERHCAEGACLAAADDPALFFCAQPCGAGAACLGSWIHRLALGAVLV
jgi:hypothetical protein